MDFGYLPPEVNSGRIYLGPGSGPMLAAAAAWDVLAGELHTAATAYGSVISELTAGPWLGAASAAMSAAAQPYVAWMRSTASEAEQTASHSRAAAAAYDVTRAAMVPPTVIAANRSLLQALVATNLFGQNAPEIAVTETLYAEMWAQDATAMYGYAGASASATTLTPFTPAPPTTNGTSPATGVHPAALPSTSVALQGVTSTSPTGAGSGSVLASWSSIESNELFLPNVAQAGLTPLNTTAIFQDLQFDDNEQRFLAVRRTEEDIYNALRKSPWGLTQNLPELSNIEQEGSSTEGATARVGQAAAMGRLSVPPGWAVAAPEMRLAALTMPAASVAAAPEVLAAGPGSMLGEMTLANMAGQVLSGRASSGTAQRTGSMLQGRASQKTPSSSAHSASIAADIHDFAAALMKLGDLRDSGLLTEDEFAEQKGRLLAQ